MVNFEDREIDIFGSERPSFLEERLRNENQKIEEIISQTADKISRVFNGGKKVEVTLNNERNN